ncbi:hypothetical protein [Sediminibacillus sp. JSM 1682029]|uniref:hypothetical protein n=1 Tax=Sediminibacillus sp. JSM 1682029 TaxID=3229857 RepID=UPI003523C2B0
MTWKWKDFAVILPGAIGTWMFFRDGNTAMGILCLVCGFIWVVGTVKEYRKNDPQD